MKSKRRIATSGTGGLKCAPGDVEAAAEAEAEAEAAAEAEAEAEVETEKNSRPSYA